MIFPLAYRTFRATPKTPARTPSKMPELDIFAKVEWKCVPWDVDVDFNRETEVEYNWVKHRMQSILLKKEDELIGLGNLSLVLLSLKKRLRKNMIFHHERKKHSLVTL